MSRLRVALGAIIVLAAGCGSTDTNSATPIPAPVVAPAGAGPYKPPPSTTHSTQNCDTEASLPPLATLPSPTDLPPASFEAAIRARGYLIAGVDQNTYLWAYRDPASGQLSGFDIDMLRQVSQAIFGAPDQIHFVIVPNADRISAVQSGRVDVVAETMTITCERKQAVNFSSVYYEAGQRILAPIGSPITSAQDLGGRRVCATAGSTSLHNLAGLGVTPPVKEVAVTNQSDCLVMLQQRQVDAISTDDTILQGLAAQDPNVSIVGSAFTREPYGMAMSKSHPELTAFVNSVLENERTDGTWTAIYTKWLGRFAKGAIPAPPPPTYQAGA